MPSPLRIMFVASEIEGLAKTGGLADVAKSLPIALHHQGMDVRLIMPYYRSLTRYDEAKKLCDLQLSRADGGKPLEFSLHYLYLGDVMVYLIGHDAYFNRPELYSEGAFGYDDNGERFGFFSRAVFEVCEYLDFAPDIFHCNDWHTGLVPFLLKQEFCQHRLFAHSKSILTIHNAAYQGIFERSQFDQLDGAKIGLFDLLIDQYQCINLLKTGILYADKINAVSPNYARELLTRLGSHGLGEVFRLREDDLVGILNGCDYGDWDPATDPHIPANYSAADLSGKQVCRQSLQVHAEFEQENVPIFGMVCRLTEQKGFFLLLPALEKFLCHRVQVVIVGTGDEKIAASLKQLERSYPDKLRFFNTYSNELAHLVEAGSDYFLMPSLFEPCGLNQMYSLAYGTLPIVRGVGGLLDTVEDYDNSPEDATGHVFYHPDTNDLLNTLRRALLLYLEHPEEIAEMRQRAMHTRFEWRDSVDAYQALYRLTLSESPF